MDLQPFGKMDPPRDFHRTKGVKHSNDRKLPKEAVKNRTAEMAKARRKQAKATYNGPREAYWPDQETIDWETAYEMYLEDLCYTDGQRALAEQAVHDWYKNAFMADDMYETAFL